MDQDFGAKRERRLRCLEALSRRAWMRWEGGRVGAVEGSVSWSLSSSDMLVTDPSDSESLGANSTRDLVLTTPLEATCDRDRCVGGRRCVGPFFCITKDETTSLSLVFLWSSLCELDSEADEDEEDLGPSESEAESSSLSESSSSSADDPDSSDVSSSSLSDSAGAIGGLKGDDDEEEGGRAERG